MTPEEMLQKLQGNPTMAQTTNRLMRRIREQAILFVDANLTGPRPTKSDYLLVENAMLIGANIGIEETTLAHAVEPMQENYNTWTDFEKACSENELFPDKQFRAVYDGKGDLAGTFHVQRGGGGVAFKDERQS